MTATTTEGNCGGEREGEGTAVSGSDIPFPREREPKRGSSLEDKRSGENSQFENTGHGQQRERIMSSRS